MEYEKHEMEQWCWMKSVTVNNQFAAVVDTNSHCQ